MKTLTSPVAAAVGTNALVLITGLIASVLLARAMGPEGRGAVAAALLWPGLLTAVGTVGLFPSTLYFSARQSSFRAGAVFANAVLISCVLTVLVVPIAYLALPFLLNSQSQDVIASARLYLFAFPVSLIAQSGTHVLQANMEMRLFNMVRALVPVGYLVGIALLGVVDALSVFHIAMLLLGLNVAALLGTLAALHKMGMPIMSRPHMTLVRRMLHFGVRAQLGDVAYATNLRVDQAVIAAWLPAKQLGLYVAAVSVTNVQQVLSGGVRMVLLPRIAAAQTPEGASSLLRGMFRRYFLVGIAATFAMATILPFAFTYVYGAAFAEGLPAAEVLLVAGLLLGCKDVLSGAVQALGHPWQAARGEVAALMVTAIVLPPFIMHAGIMGAAITSVMAYAVAFLVVIRWIHRHSAISASTLLAPGVEDVKSILHMR
jgi:O-antigen/teichoic acid export membrane protein